MDRRVWEDLDFNTPEYYTRIYYDFSMHIYYLTLNRDSRLIIFSAGCLCWDSVETDHIISPNFEFRYVYGCCTGRPFQSARMNTELHSLRSPRQRYGNVLVLYTQCMRTNTASREEFSPKKKEHTHTPNSRSNLLSFTIND